MRFFHRRPAQTPQSLQLVYGVTRAGTVGVGVYRDGKLAAWGKSESAALESLKVRDAA